MIMSKKLIKNKEFKVNKNKYEQTTLTFNEEDAIIRKRIEGKLSIIDTWRIGAKVAGDMGVISAKKKYLPDEKKKS